MKICSRAEKAASFKNVFSQLLPAKMYLHQKCLSYSHNTNTNVDLKKYLLAANSSHKNVFSCLSGFPIPPHLQASEGGNLSSVSLPFSCFRETREEEEDISFSLGDLSISSYSLDRDSLYSDTIPEEDEEGEEEGEREEGAGGLRADTGVTSNYVDQSGPSP